jgi:hypothetical protein
MRIIRPTTISNAMVLSTTAVEAHANWASGTTYAVGANVVRGDSVYESIQASNLNKDPLTEPTWWVRISSSNKMAMFDGQINDMTTGTAPLTVTVQPGSIIDSVSLIGIFGFSAQLIVRDGGPSGAIVYDQTQSLQGGESISWYQYFFFDPFLIRTQALFSGIPPIGDPHLTIILDGVGEVKIGEAVMGRDYEIGCAAFGARAGIIDYSRKETDEFGNTTFVKRAFSKRVECQVIIDNAQLNRVQRTLYDVRATPLTWIVSDNPQYEEPMVIFGFYRDFTTEIAYPAQSLCNIEIEGLI